MSRMKDSKFMYTAKGSGLCDCCEEFKDSIVLIVTLSATIGICTDCLPDVMQGIEETAKGMR